VRFEEEDFTAATLPLLPTMEYRPSWQNATESMINICEHVHMVVAKRGDRVVGYGLLLKERGRLAQFGFADDFWGEEITLPLMERLLAASEVEEIFAINIDEKAEKSLALLESCGFKEEVRQWEMMMELS